MDRLADAVGITSWEMRNRNVVSPGAVWGPGQILDDGCLGAQACLDAVRPAYEAAQAEGKAVGLGLGLKNSGLGNGFKEIAKAVVHFRPDDGSGRPTVEVRHCWTEMGQGIHTVALQVAVEELGVEADQIEVIVDTTRELGAGQTTGSRGIPSWGPGRWPTPAARPWPTAAGSGSTTRASTGSIGPTPSTRGSTTPSSTPPSATPPSS